MSGPQVQNIRNGKDAGAAKDVRHHWIPGSITRTTLCKVRSKLITSDVPARVRSCETLSPRSPMPKPRSNTKASMPNQPNRKRKKMIWLCSTPEGTSTCVPPNSDIRHLMWTCQSHYEWVCQSHPNAKCLSTPNVVINQQH